MNKIRNVFGQKGSPGEDPAVDDAGSAEVVSAEVHEGALDEPEFNDGTTGTKGVLEGDKGKVGPASAIPLVPEDQRDRVVQKAKAELESELKEFLKDTDLLFIVTDLKSPFGLDNSLTAAKLARSENAITVGLVVLPNTIDRLEDVENGNRSLQAFRLMADIIVVVPSLKHVIDGYLVLIISELIELMTISGLINLDVADVKTVVGGGNVAMIGFGAGFNRDEDKIMGAINEAVSSPVLNVDLNGVNRTLVNVTGDSHMTISEAQKVAKVILDRIQPDARLIWGAAISPKLNGAIKVMVMVGVKPKNILVHIYANS